MVKYVNVKLLKLQFYFTFCWKISVSDKTGFDYSSFSLLNFPCAAMLDDVTQLFSCFTQKNFLSLALTIAAIV